MDADLTCPTCEGTCSASVADEGEWIDAVCGACMGEGRRPPTLAEWDALRAERDRLRAERDRFCRCGLAMYAIERQDGSWVYVCEDCDPDAMARVGGETP